jgi:outer membrane receptor protein involved in Fe transport
LGSIGGQYNTPVAYQSDKLINNELGWKTEWADHSVLFNGAIYQENWNNAQVAFFDPGLTGELTFNTNGPNYRVRGLESAVIWRVTHGLPIQGSGAWNSGEQTNSPFLTANANCTATSTLQILKAFTPALSPPAQSAGRLRRFALPTSPTSSETARQARHVWRSAHLLSLYIFDRDFDAAA